MARKRYVAHLKLKSKYGEKLFGLWIEKRSLEREAKQNAMKEVIANMADISGFGSLPLVYVTKRSVVQNQNPVWLIGFGNKVGKYILNAGATHAQIYKASSGRKLFIRLMAIEDIESAKGVVPAPFPIHIGKLRKNGNVVYSYIKFTDTQAAPLIELFEHARLCQYVPVVAEANGMSGLLLDIYAPHRRFSSDTEMKEYRIREEANKVKALKGARRDQVVKWMQSKTDGAKQEIVQEVSEERKADDAVNARRIFERRNENAAMLFVIADNAKKVHWLVSVYDDSDRDCTVFWRIKDDGSEPTATFRYMVSDDIRPTRVSHPEQTIMNCLALMTKQDHVLELMTAYRLVAKPENSEDKV